MKQELIYQAILSTLAHEANNLKQTGLGNRWPTIPYIKRKVGICLCGCAMRPL